jgi:hypothetical protein
MGVLARVQRAIEGPTAEAQKLLAETPNSDDHERLSVLVNGWFRGLAAALEELAIELDAIRGQSVAGVVPHEQPSTSLVPGENDSEAEAPGEPASALRREPVEGIDEATLAERARASRAETRALREEGDQ